MEYVNLCYDIQDMVKLNAKITELVKHKGLYKLHIKKEMAARGLKRRELLKNPDMIEPPTVNEWFKEW